MQIHVPDPAYTGSARAHANFRLRSQDQRRLRRPALVDRNPELGTRSRAERVRRPARGKLERTPRHPVTAPLVHGGFGHLLSNSLPLLVLGVTMLYLLPAIGPAECCPRSTWVPASRSGCSREDRAISAPAGSSTVSSRISLSPDSCGVTDARSPPRFSSRFMYGDADLGRACRSSLASRGKRISRPR